jgi:hypothetical protein
MLIDFLPRYEDDSGADPQGGSSGKTRASDLRAQLGAQIDEQALMRLLEKQAELLTDNSQLREQRRTLRQEITDLKAKVAPEGVRMLTADEAPLWDAYTALGKPDELKQAIDANGEATQKLARLERVEQIRAAAEAHGYKAGLLSELRSLDGKAIETREIEEQGQKVKRAFVKDGDAELSLPDFLTKRAPDAIGALTVNAAPAGTSYVPQSVGDKSAPTTAGKAYTQNQKYAIPGKAS